MSEEELFLGKYNLKDGFYHYRSPTSVIILASDTSRNDAVVALKFLSQFQQFEKELSARKDTNPTFICPIIASYSSEGDTSFASAVKSHVGLLGYNYLLVLPYYERNLTSILMYERLVGCWDELPSITRNIVNCLSNLHERHRIHGDLTPSNIMRGDDGQLLILDLDSSVSFDDGCGRNICTAYIPPEMVIQWRSFDGDFALEDIPEHPEENLINMNDKNMDEIVSIGSTSSQIINSVIIRVRSEIDEIKAHPSFDIWSLGMILYYMFTGETFFHLNVDDDLTEQESLWDLYEWADLLKSQKLERITNKKARNLVSNLLIKDPMKRLTIPMILDHPFLTGAHMSRMLGERPKYDIYISYNHEIDGKIANRLIHFLTSFGLTVYKSSSHPSTTPRATTTTTPPLGNNLTTNVSDPSSYVDKSFEALLCSRIFLPLVSFSTHKNLYTATGPEELTLEPGSTSYNIIFDYRNALQLHKIGFIEHILPVLITTPNTTTIPQAKSPLISTSIKGNQPVIQNPISLTDSQRAFSCDQDIVIEAIEEMSMNQFQKQSLLTYLGGNSDRWTLNNIMTKYAAFPHISIENDHDLNIRRIAERVKKIIENYDENIMESEVIGSGPIHVSDEEEEEDDLLMSAAARIIETKDTQQQPSSIDLNHEDDFDRLKRSDIIKLMEENHVMKQDIIESKEILKSKDIEITKLLDEVSCLRQVLSSMGASESDVNNRMRITRVSSASGSKSNSLLPSGGSVSPVSSYDGAPSTSAVMKHVVPPRLPMRSPSTRAPSFREGWRNPSFRLNSSGSSESSGL